MSCLGESFVDTAGPVAHIARAGLRELELPTMLGWWSFQHAWGNLMVLLGAARGQVGRAILPAAARSLFEDGARWAWFRSQVQANPSGDSLRALLADGQRHLVAIRDGLRSDGVPEEIFRGLVGTAADLLDAAPGDGRLPPIREMLPAAHPTASGVESARPMYSVLSQFVHATPLSVLHLRHDEFTSLTGPTYAIAVEAACRGFFNVAAYALPLCTDGGPDLDAALEELLAALVSVIEHAARWHVLG